MRIGIPIYNGVNLLDVAGPLEMFYWANQAILEDTSKKREPLETVLVSAHGGVVTSINNVRFEAQASFDDVPELDVIWVPGGSPNALAAIMKNPNSPYLQYLLQIAKNAQWVCSVCEGALLLARAGLLDDHRATTHWYFVECLKQFPKITVDTHNERYVVSDQGPGKRRLTGGGISSGLDEALKLISLLYDDDIAKATQVSTQYFPKPPVMGQLPSAPNCCPVNWGQSGAICP